MSARALVTSTCLEPEQEAAAPIEKAGQALPGILTANTSFVVWLISLGFGGALLVLYYTHIHYFPELEWKESLTYLAALSLLGGTIAVLYGLLLFFPGLIWSEFLIHDSALEDKLCYKAGDHLEACYRGVGLHMALPFLVFMAVMHFAALTKNPWQIAAIVVGLLAPISVLLALRFQRHLDKRKKEHEWVAQTSPGSLLTKYVGLFNVSALISLVSLLFLYAIVDPDKESWRMFLICTVVVVVTNLLVAVQYRRRPGRAVVTAVLATLVLLGCGEGFMGPQAALSSKLMAHFGIGVYPVTLVVKEEATGIFAGHNVPFESRPGAVTVQNARILSRLGKEFFVEAGGRRIAIPRDWVLSWSAPAL